MKLETIDQKTDRLLFHIWFLTGHFNSLLSSCCEEECDLSIQEIKAIEFLGRIGPSKMKALADYLKLAVSSTTTLADNLEAKGAVKRERSLEDRRVIILQLTEEGLRDYQITVEAYKQFCRNILQTLDMEDQTKFLELFDKVHNSYVNKQ